MGTGAFFLIRLIWASTACPPCHQSAELLADGDTVAAVALLERAASLDTASGRVKAELGLLLTRLAPTEETDFQERVRARRILEEAVATDPDEPRAYLALGLLARKRGERVDALRHFDRALQKSATGGSLDHAALAELHLERGRVFEETWLDLYGFIPNDQGLSVTAPDCPGTFCRNFSHPRSFHETLLTLPTADAMAEPVRREMEQSLALAFELDPSSEETARAWLGELARQERWPDFVFAADTHLALSASGWARLFLALGRYRTSDLAAAQENFDTGLESLPEEERRGIMAIGEVVGRRVESAYEKLNESERASWAEHLWLRSDPLYTTPANERLLEHFARWTLAELWFGVPSLGVRGHETEPGRIMIRYGPPRYVRQIVRDQERARTGAALRTGKSIEELINDRFLYHAEYGGRWVLWTYESEVPSFVFKKDLRSRHYAHEGLSNSAHFEQQLREEGASQFRLPGLMDLSAQLARFRGADGMPELDIYAGIPGGEGVPDTLTVGVYFPPARPGEPVIPVKRRVPTTEGGRVVGFRVPLERGSYTVSVEAADPSGDYAAALRTELAMPEPGEALSLSDLLLAHSVEPLRADPRSRRDFRIRARPSAAISDPALALYFEVYDLTSDGGLGRYRVTLSLHDAQDRSVVAQVLGALAALAGRAGEGADRITWSRTVEALGTAVPDWFELDLSALDAGPYLVRLEVEDLNSGATAVSERQIHVEAAGGNPSR